MRQMLDEAVTAGDVAVNPRYNATYRLPVQLGQEAQSWFAVELGESAPVNDAPVEAPPAQEQNGQG